MDSEIEVLVAKCADDLTQALEIRRKVFAEEQNIPAHLDSDGLDDAAIHVICRDNGKAVATGRLFPGRNGSGVLSRIAVLPRYRGIGLGSSVVLKLELVAVAEGLKTLSLQPHKHLEVFYTNLGYRKVAGTATVGEHELITMCKQIGSNTESEWSEDEAEP